VTRRPFAGPLGRQFGIVRISDFRDLEYGIDFDSVDTAVVTVVVDIDFDDAGIAEALAVAADIAVALVVDSVVDDVVDMIVGPEVEVEEVLEMYH